VIISRGPRAWGLTPGSNKPAGLAYPASQCEICCHKIAIFDLIPIVSWLILRGRCRNCLAPIGARHLLVEVIGGMIGLLCIWQFGISVPMAFAAVLLFVLLTLAVIDAETGYLPDGLTYPLIAMGLLASLGGFGPSLVEAIIGGVAGGGSFFVLAWGYRTFRGFDGLGGGDIKLITAAGIWCGPWDLPVLILLASVAGLLFAGARILLGGEDASPQLEIRFGPFLAVATAITYLVPLPFAPS